MPHAMLSSWSNERHVMSNSSSTSQCMSTPPKQLWMAATLLLASLLAWPTAANEVDPSRPATIVVGAPRGHVVRARLGPHRHGQSRYALPASAKRLWRRSTFQRLLFPPLVDARGGVIAAAGTTLRYISASGKVGWRAALGSTIIAPPVLTSDGAIVVIGGDGMWRRVSASGKVTHRLKLGKRRTRTSTLPAPLALDDGSVVVAVEQRAKATSYALLRVASDGTEQARVPMPQLPSGALLAHAGGVLVTTRAGAVWHWRPPAVPRRLGAFGGLTPNGAVLVSKRTLVAVTRLSTVEALDLVSGKRSTIFSGQVIDDPVTFDAKSGMLLFSTAIGELIGVDARGQIKRRAPLSDQPIVSLKPPPRVARRFGRRRWRSSRHVASPPLLVGAAGRIAFVRHGGRFGLIDTSDRITWVAPWLCSRVLGVWPAGKGRLLVGCRSGMLSMWGQERAKSN